jgi:hypothetical protein
MIYSFNLIDREWIPCIQPDGGLAEFSLRQVLQRAHELRGVHGTVSSADSSLT